jgi:hypothetical protein
MFRVFAGHHQASRKYIKLISWIELTLIWIHILKFGFVFDSEYTFVKYNLSLHTRTLVMYGFYLSLRLFKTNIYYDFVFNINNYINVVYVYYIVAEGLKRP